jgi:hypothetical protein
MRLRKLQRQKRNELGWYLLGCFVVQLGVGVCVDRYLPAVRDPDYVDLEQRLRQRRQEAPGRPLVLFLGSSRTQMGVDAGRLNVAADPQAPLVFNAAICGGGPMMNQIVLRRLLKAGFRPQYVFVEVMPMALSARHGAANEERQTFLGRYTAREVRRLWHYYAEPYRLLQHWGKARLLPCCRHQVELREALGIDLPACPAAHDFNRDAFGWCACHYNYGPAEVALRTEDNLATYNDALSQPAMAPGVLQAVRDVVHLCQDRHIGVTLFVPPESSAFRTHQPAVAALQENTLRDLARELRVPLINARAWIPDNCFWDGHHLTAGGAEVFTDRLGKRVFGLGTAANGTSAAAPAWRHLLAAHN